MSPSMSDTPLLSRVVEGLKKQTTKKKKEEEKSNKIGEEMNSSLMVEGDRRCACQKGNQLKIKKSQLKERCEEQERDSTTHVTSGYFCDQSLMRRNQSFMDVCVCGCMHVRFCIFSSLSVLTAVISVSCNI